MNTLPSAFLTLAAAMLLSACDSADGSTEATDATLPADLAVDKPFTGPECPCTFDEGRMRAVQCALGGAGRFNQDLTFPDRYANQVDVTGSFGRNVAPESSPCLVVLSTGLARSPADGIWSAAISQPNGIEISYSSRVFEAEMDTIYMDVLPSREHRGFQVDVMFISADWPEASCADLRSRFNIGFWNAESGDVAPVLGAEGIDTSPEFILSPTVGVASLAGTPFGEADRQQDCSSPPCSLAAADVCVGDRLPVGGRTPWLRLRLPYDIADVQAIAFMLEEGTSQRDAVLLISNMTWLDDPPATATIEALPEL